MADPYGPAIVAFRAVALRCVPGSVTARLGAGRRFFDGHRQGREDRTVGDDDGLVPDDPFNYLPLGELQGFDGHRWGLV